MAWIYAIPQYNNWVFFVFVFLMSHKIITAEVHPNFILNFQKRLFLTPDDKFWRIFITHITLVPAQDVHFFYTRSHLSALQNCVLLLSTNFQFIFIFKKCITQFSPWIVLYTIFFKNIAQVFIKFTHSFVAIELFTFCKNAKKLFYCSRELLVLRT